MLSTDRIASKVVFGAMLLTAATLIALYDRRLINPDTIQLLDAARHLLAGDGYSSSIAYYESQLQFGRMPAPLTVWPPGFSWLLLLPLKLGLPAEAAAFVLCAAGHLTTAWLVFVVTRRLAGPTTAALAAITWLLHAIALMVVLALYAEPIFIAFTVASYVALIEAGKDQGWSVRWLLVSGIAASCAVLMRYSGVLWPIAAGLWLLMAAMRSRSWQPIRAAIIFGVLPAIATGALFWRNFLLTQTLSGGVFDYGGVAGITGVARRLLWDSNFVLGKVLRLSPILFALVIGTLIVATVLLARRLHAAEPRNAAVGLAISNVAVLLAFLVDNAIESSILFLDYRYLVPSLPFIAIIVSLVAHDALLVFRARTNLRAALWPAMIVASSVLLVGSVLAQLPQRWPIRTVHSTIAMIEQGLAERMPDGRTLREMLTTMPEGAPPLLGYLEHRLSAQTGRAVVGLTDARYTQRVWTSEEVRELVQRQHIEQVVFFPPAFDPKIPENANLQFWNELLAGRAPAWLKPRYVSRSVAVYDVVMPALSLRTP